MENACYTIPCPPFGPDAERRLYTGERVFYHGGARGLRVGSWILPPTVTGAARSATAANAGDNYYPDQVYFTADIGRAKMFAALGPAAVRGRGGDVYRVVPALLVSLDPDCAIEGVSWCAPAALIVAIAATGVRRAPYEDALIKGTTQGEVRPHWSKGFSLTN